MEGKSISDHLVHHHYLLFLIVVVVGLIMCSIYPAAYAFGEAKLCIETEKQALLDFKHGFVDRYNLLSSWGGREDDCCLWQGVGCHHQTGNIIKLDLGRCYNHMYCFDGKISDSLLKLRQLSHLDLSGLNFFESIPKFIGSLSNLRYLNLSALTYRENTMIPEEISNLSSLHTLDLSKGYSSNLQISKLGWLSQAYSLRHLDLSVLDLSRATDWLQTIAMLPSLSTLKMALCELPRPPKLLPPQYVNISNHQLRYLHFAKNDFELSDIIKWLPNLTSSVILLDLFGNGLSGPIPEFFWSIPSLRHLDLSYNGFEGGIPNQFGNLTSLEYLDLTFNNFEGGIPRHLGRLGNLQTLKLSQNMLNGQLAVALHNFTTEWSSDKVKMETLDLSNNNFEGVVPELIRTLPNLKALQLSGNNLTSVVPEFSRVSSSSLQELYLASNRFVSVSRLIESIGRLSNNLKVLDISSNPFNSVIVEAHLNNFSSLEALVMSDLHLSLGLEWIPPFQLRSLQIGSCHLGPHFPLWLQTQTNLMSLDISNNGISSTIPGWFWNIFNTSSFHYLNISQNHLSGTFFNVSPINPASFVRIIDLSYNNLRGPIPPNLLDYTLQLDLSSNFFSGNISVLCTRLFESVAYLDLSNNSLSGELPDCWSRWAISLGSLNLADNNFYGNVPQSIGSLSEITTLRLRNNNFSGELPSSLKNCTQLQVLDLMENSLSGVIPGWIGECLGNNLQVLTMRSNKLHGNIPSSICYLQQIQILDLSLNNLSGGIPKCLDNFTTMSSQSALSTLEHSQIKWTESGINSVYSVDDEVVELKGIVREYKNSFGLIKLIDLSSNRLIGGIPRQVTNLKYLISLNLSRNFLTGVIPTTISRLRSLDTLDLSRNQLTGEIPSGLSALSQLGTLNLSSNNLYGRIPLGTQLQSFDPSVYQGNLRLCGLPLTACLEDGVPQQKGVTDSKPNNHSNDQDELLSLPFYIGAILGFVFGFWGVFGSLVMISPWRCAYFEWLSHVKDYLYVKLVVSMARFLRRFR